MTDLFEVTDAADRRLALGATGLLREFNEAGVLTAADVHVARRVGRLAGESDERVLLAAALAIRAVRHGSVCVDLVRGRRDRPRPALAGADGWSAAVAASPLVEVGVLRGEFDLLYLDRYWHQEVAALRRPRGAAATARRPSVDAGRAGRRARPGVPRRRLRRAAGRLAAGRRPQWTTVLTGGPGTGKTTTVAGLLALLAEQAERTGGPPLRVALTAPTGKAAARLQEAVARRSPGCRRPDRRPGRRLAGGHPAPAARHPPRQRHPVPAPPRQPAAARRGRGRRVVDGVADDDDPAGRGGAAGRAAGPGRRPRPARLGRGRGGARRPGLRPGRPGPTSPVVRLATTHRFGAEIGALAAALRGGRADEVLDVLRSGAGGGRVRRERRPGARCCGSRVVAAAVDVRRHAEAGRRGARGGGPGPAPAAVRAPRRPVRRAALEPAGRALARRGDRRPALRADVRRPAAAGDRQRLRARRLQRRRRRGGARRRRAARGDLRVRRAWPTSRPAG